MATPTLTASGVRLTLDEFDRLGAEAFLSKYGYGPAKSYFLERDGKKYDSKAIAGVAHRHSSPSGRPLRNSDFSGGEAQVAKHLRRLGFNVVRLDKRPATLKPTTALPLTLHGTTSRKEAYALFGIDFHQRNRQLIMGLSPQLPDGGYFIWITLDKSDLDPNYDYDDQLDKSSFVWVTRRGVKETDRDYVAVANPASRVSLFVRSTAGDEFTYLGEMRHRSHESFVAPDGRPQMRFLFELAHEVPDAILVHLYSPAVVSPGQSVGAPTKPVATQAAVRTRRATTFGEAREALAYVLGSVQRVMNPAHHNFQVRLKEFLVARGVKADFEPDFIDVRLSVAGHMFIGEIKVTNSLSQDEAFRIALGQILFYGHIRCDSPVGLIIMLDYVPENKRLELATRLGVSVVAEETPGTFTLLNPAVAPALTVAFPKRQE